jgi:hypothetical protein
MKHRCHHTRVLAVGLVVCGIVGWGPDPGAAQEHQAETESHEEEDSGHHANHIALFTGATSENADGGVTTSVSLGLDYERRVSPLIGLVVGGEAVFGGHEREALLGVLVNFHVARGLILGLGPGVEFSKERSEAHEEGPSAAGNEEGGESGTEVALRMGGLYEFDLGRRGTIAPTLYVDMISGKMPVWVGGVSVGVGF